MLIPLKVGNLLILEQLENCVPCSTATFINERNPKSPDDVAVLADEYVLTHKTTFTDMVQFDAGCSPTNGKRSGAVSESFVSYRDRQSRKKSVMSLINIVSAKDTGKMNALL